ncbi:methyltransferase [Martelella alba]|uniref:Methyltransferase n=1 Tax=Martelella alba TaxID=2590451 RepID=A0A506U8V0_9HYPH|nr:methyltransferase [Martelella alba]TPW30852.1 methyltransferase [Martelella alba]
MMSDTGRFILDNTEILTPPHVPEIRLRLASEVHDLWLKTEEELQEIGLPPPFWAFAWAGGQGLARYILDHPAAVEGKRVVDFASGSGLVAIAAARAGASSVLAADIDRWSAAAMALNAALNAVTLEICTMDLIGTRPDADVLLAGDVFYDREFAVRLLPWFRDLAADGMTVLIGDPGRAYLPKTGLVALASYQVPVTRVLEDSEIKKTTVWAFTSQAGL